MAMDAMRDVINQMAAYDQGARDGKQSAAEEIVALRRRVAELSEALAEAHKFLPYGGTRDYVAEVLGLRVELPDDEEE